MPFDMAKLRKALVAFILSVLTVGALVVAMPVAALWATQKYAYAEHKPAPSSSSRDDSVSEPSRIRCMTTYGHGSAYITRCS
jgi:hypothetical protein